MKATLHIKKPVKIVIDMKVPPYIDEVSNFDLLQSIIESAMSRDFIKIFKDKIVYEKDKTTTKRSKPRHSKRKVAGK